MDRSELEGLLDAILNRADFRDIEVLRAAVERRTADLNRVGRAGFDPGKMAGTMAASIRDQIGGTREELDGMVRGLVEGLIRQKVPDIPPEHLEALLAEWLPDAHQRETRRQAAESRPIQRSPVPVDVLLVMIRDFISYSTGAMTAGKQIALNDEIPNWPDVYWKRFPERVHRLIKVFLDGKLPVEVFWQEIKATLEG